MSSDLFERVGDKHRWRGPLAGDPDAGQPGLLQELRSRAWGIGMQTPPGYHSDQRREQDKDFAWVVLKGGAVVGVRVRGDMAMRNEIRIARSELPETDEARAKWQKELEVFYDHFDIEVVDGETPATRETGHSYLLREPHPNDEGKAAVRLLELRKGEMKPGVARCYHCLTDTGEEKLVPWFPGGGVKGQACNAHAVQNGREHTRRAQEDRQLEPQED